MNFGCVPCDECGLCSANLDYVHCHEFGLCTVNLGYVLCHEWIINRECGLCPLP